MGASRTILPTVYMPASTRADLEKRHRSAGTSGDHVEAVHDHNTWGPIRVKRKKTRMDGVLEVAGSKVGPAKSHLLGPRVELVINPRLRDTERGSSRP